jgi:Fe-S-cluster-containing dehydrogenase component/formate-dependent nitrite reductase membrane component NrfD
MTNSTLTGGAFSDVESAAADIVRWAKVIDHTRCIGCHACTTACKSENEVPLSVTRTYVKYVDVGAFPATRRAFQVTRCNQCEHAPCVTACPTSAMFRRPDGIVDFDKSICIGCKACMAACPYDAIFINPDDHSAEKCNFCAHRLDVGLEPACVVVCPTEAIIVGDLNDPLSKVSKIVHRDAVAVRRPEKDTRPKLFYKGAHQATLDPIAARRPSGGLFMWSEQGNLDDQVTSGHPGSYNSSAAAVLSYDIPHRAPWDWRVSAYTWTKGIGAGVYLVALALALLGLIPWRGMLWMQVTPVIAGVFLALTGALLIWDLEHPERFYMIFTRPQWRSWLVKGGVIITLYGALLGGHFIAGMIDAADAARTMSIAGAPLAVLTAIYTAYLFAQSKARDLWQNPLAPFHLLVQAVLAGSATLAMMPRLAVETRTFLNWAVLGSCATHLLLLLAEAPMAHTTAHAKLAHWEMTQGRYASWFWVGVIMMVLALTAPWFGAAAGIPALIGLLAYEHAYVQAAQAVPLA